MDVKTLLREQFKAAHGLLESTMQDVTEEQAHWTPPGKAIPVGATYAHAVMSEDAMLNGMVKGGAPLFATTFAGKTGLGENPPPPDQPWDEWSRSVKIDLGALRAYAKAVYAATDEYIGSATDDELARELDLSGFGMGMQPVAVFAGTLMVSHLNNHCGEVSSMKGIQGAKGYPFWTHTPPSLP